jgi:MYXO-CTERM domain-containing protein
VKRRAALASSCALAACALCLPRVALAQYIDLPGTQPGGLAMGIPLGSGRPCGVTCHFSGDPSVPTAMPYDGWIGSMMGNTLRDPLFLAALTVAEQDRPGVGDWCLRCHTPPGFVAGHTRGSPAASRGETLDAEEREGVTCDACHRMLPTTNLGNAQYEISPTDVRFGPYAMIESSRHTGQMSAWMADARLCGTCHEVSNPVQPLRRPDGTDTGQRFPLDTTYSEWARSDYATAGSPDARTCQDCHLPRLDGMGQSSNYKTARVRDRPRRHDFAGANAWGLRVLAAMRMDTDSGDFYDPTAVPLYEAGALRAEASLRSALTIELREVPTRAAPGERVEVVARVTNRTGHRVPTGYADGRRVWLEVSLLDADRRAAVLSGAYDDATARLDESAAGLHVYEAWHGRAGMGRGEHIALHDTVVRDTRIPPKGYRPLAGHEPVGADYSGGANGALRHWDDARYAITIPASARGAVTVRVRVRYQTTTREYVEFLARENRTDDRGRELLRRYEASGRAAPFDMTEATAEITVVPAPVDAGVTDASAPDAGAVDVTTRDAGMADEGPAPAPGCGCRTDQKSRESSGLWALGALAAALARRIFNERRGGPAPTRGRASRGR